MKPNHTDYRRPGYFYRLFHEGRPEEAVLADYNKRQGKRTQSFLEKIREQRAVMQSTVDPLDGIW
jgi:hypothetical protein